MSVPDNKIEQPWGNGHSESCSCRICHAAHLEKGFENYIWDCLECNDLYTTEINNGVRCSHGGYVPSDGGEFYEPCENCTNFYPSLKTHSGEMQNAA